MSVDIAKRIDRAAAIVSLSLGLFKRTIGAKYRKSFLGYSWIILQPIAIVTGVWLAHRAGVVNPGVTTLPYALFVLIGVMIWQTFAESIEVVYRAMEGARSYLTRVLFPREAILLAQAYEAAINALIRFVFVLAFATGVGDAGALGASMLGLYFLAALLLALGIGALLGPFLLLFSDLQQSLRLLLTYGIFLTPAFYLPSDGWFASAISWNPVTPLILGARSAVESDGNGSVGVLFMALTLGVSLCVIGVIFVKRSTPIVVERMLLGGR